MSLRIPLHAIPDNCASTDLPSYLCPSQSSPAFTGLKLSDYGQRKRFPHWGTPCRVTSPFEAHLSGVQVNWRFINIWWRNQRRFITFEDLTCTGAQSWFFLIWSHSEWTGGYPDEDFGSGGKPALLTPIIRMELNKSRFTRSVGNCIRAIRCFICVICCSGNRVVWLIMTNADALA